VNGEDALRALETGHFQWFYPANQGREGLFMNLIALCFKLFGVSTLTLKLPAIIFGTLTVLGVFLLAKEIFNQRTAFISAFLYAVSFWPLNISRISFRANMLPFVLVFAFYFVFRAIRTKKISDFAIGGFIFGIGMHTYIAWRIAPLILVILLISLILSRKKFLKEYWKGILTFFILFIIAAAPMLWTFYAHPEYFESRSDSISVLSPQVNGGHPIETLAKSFSLSLVKYNFWGDQNWRHGYPPYPILDPIASASFFFGFFYCLYRLIKLLRFRINGVKNNDLAIYAFLVSWFFIMLVPEFMTAEGLPHALRSIGTAPVVFLISALTLDKLISWPKRKARQKAFLIAIIIILLLVGIFNTLKYQLWSRKIESARAFDKVLIDVSDYIQTLPSDREIFIITGSMQRIPIKVLNHTLQNVSYFYPNEIAGINPKSTNNFEIILTDQNDDIVKNLKARFPKLVLSESKDSFGIPFYILK
jgi:4-amino-4-deoxy-L-arabinose transferase-like glycosyltransferase